MGKSKRSKITRQDPPNVEGSKTLTEQILEDKSVRPVGRSKHRHRQNDDEQFVDEKLSRRILETARKQQEELEEEFGVKSQIPKVKMVTLGSTAQSMSDEEESDAEDSEEEDYDDDVELDEDDEKALELFMSKNAPAKRTLADIIQEKLTEKQTEIHTQISDNASVQLQQLDDRVISMYRSIRDILAKYRSGKLPKAFKIVPALSNWEQVLYLTEPDRWSAAAVYQATRIFASNLNAKMAQRFFNLVLLPRIRDDISEFKRLNYHLYMALIKSMFKPAAFFKGVLLPLCEAGNCTLREATIIASILTKNSIPMLHSAAAILKIAEMDYNGANSIFLKSLLDKKYALPFRVIDAVVFHFLKFTTDRRELPTLWHQCLLVFCQRYKQDVSTDQRQALLDLLRAHSHPQITPEIRRELTNAKCRDEESAEPLLID